jgi:hypothetical protein
VLLFKTFFCRKSRSRRHLLKKLDPAAPNLSRSPNLLSAKHLPLGIGHLLGEMG